MSTRGLRMGMLDEILAVLAHDRVPHPEALPLARAVQEIRRRHGRATPARELVSRAEEAVMLGLSDAARLQHRHRFVLSHALACPVVALEGKSVLDHAPLAESLLGWWEQAGTAGELKLSHWRGLFGSYMQVPTGAARTRLRRLLHQTVDVAVKGRKRRPAWLDTLLRHEHILGEEPCTPYLDEMMAGEHALLAELARYVEIPVSSWFWQTLKDALIQQIGSMRESAFRASIEGLLALDRWIPQVRDDLLKAVLERYDACSDRAKHTALMEFALDAWGSPQLERQLLWNLCRPTVRRMVCGWLAKDDIEDFYRLCRADREVDEGRLEFWLLFKEQMEFTQILLGGSLRNSSDRDVRTFITRKKGRLGDLTAGESTNNAILMRIGNWLFAEFSKVGTACRVISTEDGDFRAGKSAYALPDLRQSGEQWIHLPKHGWEEKFLRLLEDKGIHPDGAAVAPAGRNHVAAVPRPTGSNDAHMLRKLRNLGLRVVDNRAKGGTVWAYANNEVTASMRRELQALGFSYKDSKQGFYLR